MPITYISSDRALGEMVRLHLTEPGRCIIARIENKTGTRAANLLEEARYLLPELAMAPGIQCLPAPPWLHLDYSIHLHILGLRRKGSLPDTAIGCLVEAHLEEAYGGFKRVYTDGSVRRGSRSATAAFAVPSIGRTWSARLSFSVSSTTAELVAIAEAMAFLTQAPPTRSVILCDSRCALRRLAHTTQVEATSTRVRLLSGKLTELGYTIIFQEILGHSDITGNVQAYRFAEVAQIRLVFLDILQDTRQFVEDLHQILSLRHQETFEKRPHLPLRGITSRDASLLMRMRTGSARTTAWLSAHSNETDATCPNFDQPEDILHAPVCCTEHDRACKRHLPELADRPATTVESIAVLFPTGCKKQWISQRDKLLQFMPETGLAERW